MIQNFTGGSIPRMTTATGNVDAGTGLLWDLSATYRQSMSPWQKGCYSALPIGRTNEMEKRCADTVPTHGHNPFYRQNGRRRYLSEIKVHTMVPFQHQMMLPVWKKELTQGAPCTGQMLSKKPPVDCNKRVETGDGSHFFFFSSFIALEAHRTLPYRLSVRNPQIPLKVLLLPYRIAVFF